MEFKDRYQYHPRTDLLGKGGFARVFKAYDTLLDREVALKVFNTEASTKYDLVAEIKKVIKLDHPNLCRYYDVAFVESVSAFNEEEKHQVGIMEYINGGELKAYIKAHPESLDGLLKGILQGLSFLHKRHIVHRDLKPQNILVNNTEDGPVAKITDFGISKDTGAAGNTASSQLMGTIEFMAPEQFNPAKYGIDGRISTNLDLWSFGVMLYELAMPGSKLFPTASTEQMMNNILDLETVLPKLITLKQPYRAMAQRCLVKDAAQRVQNADELLAILEGKEPAPAAVAVPLDGGETRDLSSTMQHAKPVDSGATTVMPKPSDPGATTVQPKPADPNATRVAPTPQPQPVPQPAPRPKPVPVPAPAKKSSWQVPAIIVAVLLLIGVIAFVNKDKFGDSKRTADTNDTTKKDTNKVDSPKKVVPKVDTVAKAPVGGVKPLPGVKPKPVTLTDKPQTVDKPTVRQQTPDKPVVTTPSGGGSGTGGIGGLGSGSSGSGSGSSGSGSGVGAAGGLGSGSGGSGSGGKGSGMGSAGGLGSGGGGKTTTQYDETASFREGMARVKLNGKYGFINTDKQLVIPIKYESANGFFNGVVPVELNNKWGLIDKNGDVVIPIKYDLAFRLAAEGLIAVELNDKWGFIDKYDNVKIPIKYEDAWSFNEGVAAVKMGGKWGFINKYGQTVVAFLYDDVDNGYLISKPTMKVKLNGTWFEIDKQGNKVD
jgi:serine/threonine protein kinase